MSGEALLTELLDRGGEDLRSVALVRGTSVSVLYTRLDVDSETVRADLASTAVDDGVPGTVEASVEVTDELISCRFPVDEGESVVARLDRTAVPRIPALVERCGPMAADGITVRGGSKSGKHRCPECGSTNYEVRSGRPGRPRKTASRYTCLYCGTNFDDPVIAENREDVAGSS